MLAVGVGAGSVAAKVALSAGSKVAGGLDVAVWSVPPHAWMATIKSTRKMNVACFIGGIIAQQAEPVLALPWRRNPRWSDLEAQHKQLDSGPTKEATLPMGHLARLVSLQGTVTALVSRARPPGNQLEVVDAPPHWVTNCPAVLKTCTRWFPVSAT